MNAKATAYIAIVGLAGAAALALCATVIPGQPADPVTILLLAALAGVSQRMPIFLFRKSAVSVSFAAAIAAYVLYGTPAGVLVNLVAAAVNTVTPRRKPFSRIVFNTGNLTVSAFLASLTYAAVGGQVPPGQIVPAVLAVVVSGFVFFLVNTGLLAGIIALTEQQPYFSVYRENFAWQIVNWLATSANGAALALAYQSIGIFGAAMFIMPLGVAWYSFKLYMANSKELRKRNEELELVNRTLETTNVRLEESHLSVVGALVGALEAKDKYTQGHSAATMFHAVELARRLGLREEDIAAVQLGALFHDVGKIGIPEHILRKPGPLTPAEWEEMKQHTIIGGNLLAHVPTLERVRPIVEAHHERFDGTGYPRGLKGEEIPVAARIITIADSFHAMTSTRAYRQAMSRATAIAELKRCAGSQFDPQIVAAFVSLLEDEARAGAAERGRGLVQNAADAAVVHQRVS